MNISLSPEVIFHIGSFPVTNAFFWSVMISLFLIIIMVGVRFSLKKVPSKFQVLIEILLEESYNFINNITGDNKKTKKLFPLILTIFLFISTANLVALLPVSSLTIKGEGGVVPLFRAVMSDYSMVFVLTSITVVLVQIVAIIVNGPFGYLSKFFNFKNIFKNPKSFPLDFFLGIMDLVGELAKILSLSFRLFGNIFAGEVLGIVMLSLMPFFIPLPFMFLSILTAIVQAFVFAMLTLVFISMASEKQEDD